VDLGNFDQNHFFKYSIEGRFVWSIREALIFANFARVGGSYGLSGNVDDDLPVAERFQLGGRKGIRGFLDGEVVRYARDGKPLDADPTTTTREPFVGGDFVITGSHELRFPLGFSLGPLDVWGAGFFDWGGLADGWTDFHAKSFRMSAGGGVRLLLYGRVPIRIDYGVKLERRCRAFAEDGLQCLGRESFGELEFNILYTF
jgi:outer membrane protein assembly factor BamA